MLFLISDKKEKIYIDILLLNTMLQTTTTLEDILSELDYPEEILSLEVIPEQSSYMVYGDVLAWQQSMLQEIDGILSEYNPCEEYDGFSESLLYAVENAWMHGNRQDSSLPIHIAIYQATDGLAFEVSDQGTGFDVQGTIGKFKKNDEVEVYYTNLGMGMMTFDESPCIIAYNESGTSCYGILRYNSSDDPYEM